MKKPYKIGLTGGIGSGKTTIAEIFKSIGVPVFNSDKSGRLLLRNDKNIINKITSIFGTNILTQNIINTEKLAQIVFSNKQKLELLNNIIHPAVEKKFNEWFKKQNTHYIIKESALLFEANIYNMLDKIILVKAPIQIRKKRISKRDKRTHNEIQKIINNQIKVAKIIKKVDYIIQNNEKTLLTPKIITLHQTLSDL